MDATLSAEQPNYMMMCLQKIWHSLECIIHMLMQMRAHVEACHGDWGSGDPLQALSIRKVWVVIVGCPYMASGLHEPKG